MPEKNSSDNMQNRINNIFTESDLPAPASLKEVQAMKIRIKELEDELTQTHVNLKVVTESLPQNTQSVKTETNLVEIPVQEIDSKISKTTLSYTLIGLAFGFLFPIIGTVINMWVAELPITLNSFLLAQASDPLLWIIDTAPIFLGGFAMLVGKRQDAVQKTSITLQQREKEYQSIQIDLEQRVHERTHDLELASEVGKTITTKVENLYQLLSDAVEQIRSHFNLYYTQVYLTDRVGRTITLRAGTGDVGKQLLQRGHQLLISSDSLNGRAALEKYSVIVADTSNSRAFLPNPLLPKTRSEMAIPLMIGNQVIGVLDMQSDKTNALNENNLASFEILAGQLAVAIQNAALFEQANQARAEVTEQAKRLSLSSWDSFLNAVDRSEKIGYVYNQNEVLPYLNTAESDLELNTLNAPIQVAGAEIGKIQIADAANRQWTSAEKELLENTAEQLASHIENLRLLTQSEKYRLDAEQISKRLTRESWNEYFNLKKNAPAGFAYNKNKVEPISEQSNGNKKRFESHPMYVRDEQIGELEIESTANLDSDSTEIISAITQQLSNHIENLRLLEQAELSHAETQKSQEQFNLAVAGSNDGIWDWNIANDSIYYSPRWKGMLGYEEHELTRGFVEWEELVHPDDKEFATTSLEKYLAQQAPEYDVELRLRHKDGRYVWIRDRGKALRRPDGAAYRMAGAHTDITERKRDEELLAQRANQLETVATVSTTASTVLNPDALLNQVVNLTKSRFNLYHAHIYLLDENWNTLLLASGAGEVGAQMVESGHAIDFNAERSLVARAAREKQPVIINDVRSEVGFLPNPLLPETLSELAIPMLVGENVLGVFDVQSNQVDAFSKEDASIYSTLASQIAVALQNARLYQEQSATVTQLRELDRLKSSFLANMSHELRTPLNSILGFTDVMLEGLDGPLTPNMDNDLKLINKNGQHLLHLINDVLDMAKIESGKLNLIIEKFSVQEIFEEVINITSPFANEKKLTLKVDTKSDIDVTLNADRTRIRQVMINLVNNALKFTEKGKIIVRAIREENNVLISVKDTGIGIPPEHLEAVFSEFTQVDSSTTRKAGGTGLGLPISRKLIDLHGGKIWAESNGVEGQGSTFFVFMPLENRTAISEPVTRKIE
jgi:PAS domain S-box-containing protein